MTLVDPAGISTVLGTVAFKLLELNEMVAPPAGAAPLRVTVPTDKSPPVTDVGERVSVESVSGRTLKLVDLDVPLRLAVTTANTLLDEAVVLTMNVAVVAPAGIDTNAGTETPAPVAVTETFTPPVGAPRLRVIVPVVVAPPMTVVGLTVSDWSKAV